MALRPSPLRLIFRLGKDTHFSLTGLCQPLITIEPVSGVKTRYQREWKRGEGEERRGGISLKSYFREGER